jgi:hypothetical protein
MTAVEYLVKKMNEMGYDIPPFVLNNALEMERDAKTLAKSRGAQSMVEYKAETVLPSLLGLETWEQLFDYIYESKLNGQKKQSKELYKSLSEQRQVEFQDYLIEMFDQEFMSAKMLAQTIKFYADKNN